MPPAEGDTHTCGAAIARPKPAAARNAARVACSSLRPRAAHSKSRINDHALPQQQQAAPLQQCTHSRAATTAGARTSATGAAMVRRRGSPSRHTGRTSCLAAADNVIYLPAALLHEPRAADKSPPALLHRRSVGTATWQVTELASPTASRIVIRHHRSVKAVIIFFLKKTFHERLVCGEQ